MSSEGCGWVPGGLYSEVQCIMGNGHMGPASPSLRIDTTENVTFPKLGWRAVKTVKNKNLHRLLICSDFRSKFVMMLWAQM